MATFYFRPVVRSFVRELTKLMYFANDQNTGKWSYQTGGVYGAAHDAVMRIIVEECGQQVADRLDSFNFGGHQTWLASVEAAVEEAMEEIEEENRVECEKDEEAERCREV